MSIKEQSRIVQAIMLDIKGLDWDSCLAIAQFAIAEVTDSHEDEEAKARIMDTVSILAYNLDEIIEEGRCWKDVQPHRKEQA